jgi:hypothetical protein
MANELHVDVGGLQIGAANGDLIATTLTGGQFDATSSPQPGSAGIARVNTALAALRARHSNRITGQAGDLTASSGRYNTTDGDGSEAITTVSV